MKTPEFIRGLIKTTKVPDNIRETLAKEFVKKKAKGKIESFIERGIKREKKKAVTFIKFLNNALAYIETNPREEFLNKQLRDLKKRETDIVNNFDNWIKSIAIAEYKDKTTAQLKPIWRKEMGLKKIQDQINFLNFILR